MCGSFTANRFSNSRKESTHELAMNPTYFGVTPLREIMQTMCHEMCHLYCFLNDTQGRTSYHNQAFADIMMKIGLMPSTTGRPGGNITGQNMSDYAIAEGPFMLAFQKLCTQEFQLSWFDRYVNTKTLSHSESLVKQFLADHEANVTSSLLSHTEKEELEEKLIAITGTTLAPNKETRLKYRCSCGNNVWGRNGLNIVCTDCNSVFISINIKEG